MAGALVHLPMIVNGTEDPMGFWRSEMGLSFHLRRNEDGSKNRAHALELNYELATKCGKEGSACRFASTV
jgi:hypothetical protein